MSACYISLLFFAAILIFLLLLTICKIIRQKLDISMQPCMCSKLTTHFLASSSLDHQITVVCGLINKEVLLTMCTLLRLHVTKVYTMCMVAQIAFCFMD